ncbi:MAG TPA: response regulator [Sphingobium sp.]|nr:response regulator [Sphingobium sp.]
MSELPSILLVEDNSDDYEATLRSLRENHFLNPVHWCRNGREALDYLMQAGDPDKGGSLPGLVLLDLNMPGIDGREVLRVIKAELQLRRMPVIILTTSADERDISRCYDMGASTYIQKPVSFAGLAAAIRTMKDYWFGIALLPGKPAAL